jgi:hypothetical protein
MRFVRVVYFHATEVVLLLKLGRNEVFFDINQQKNLWVLHNLPCGTWVRKIFHTGDGIFSADIPSLNGTW